MESLHTNASKYSKKPCWRLQLIPTMNEGCFEAATILEWSKGMIEKQKRRRIAPAMVIRSQVRDPQSLAGKSMFLLPHYFLFSSLKAPITFPFSLKTSSQPTFISFQISLLPSSQQPLDFHLKNICGVSFSNTLGILARWFTWVRLPKCDDNCDSSLETHTPIHLSKHYYFYWFLLPLLFYWFL